MLCPYIYRFNPGFSLREELPGFFCERGIEDNLVMEFLAKKGKIGYNM